MQNKRNEQLLADFLKHKFSEGSELSFIRKCDAVILEFFEFCQAIGKDLNKINLYAAKNFQLYLLRRGLSRGTVNGYISITRVFYNYLVLVEVVEMNPFRLLTSMHVIPFDPPFVPMAELKKVFRYLDAGLFLPIHYLAIFECLYATGITGVELMHLRREDFNRDMESLVIRATNRSQEREVPIPAQSMYVIKHYVNYRNLHFPLSKFLVVTKRGCKLYYKVINSAVKSILANTSVKQKGVPVVKNTYRQHLLASGAKIQIVGLLTGKRMQALIRHDGWKILSRLKLIHTMYHPRG